METINICRECSGPLGDSCVVIPANPANVLSSEVYCCNRCIDDDIRRYPDHYSQVKLTRKFLNKNTNKWEPLKIVQ